MAYKQFVCNVRGSDDMSISSGEKTPRIGDTVSYLDSKEALSFGEVKSIDEGDPALQLVIEFDDRSTKHFSLAGCDASGRKLTVIHRKK